MRTVRCLVGGLVQGVFFRASARQHASRLGLTGWVRNLKDGRVEAVICGQEASVEEMIAWLHHGPAGAHVTKVETTAAETVHHATFDILPDA